MIRLPSAARVAVVAPSGIHGEERLAAGLSTLRARGLDLVVPDDLQVPWRFLAGDDDHRRAQLLAAWQDPDVDALWVSRGGYGIARLLADLPLADLPDKLVLGFSDVTALFCAMRNAGMHGAVHAPVIHSVPITSEASIDHLVALLAGAALELSGETWVAGTAEGPLVGGNLCVLASLCGTPWQLDPRGGVLLLEDINEPPYKIDRMLLQLRLAGVLDEVAAVAVGEFTGCDAPAGATWTIRDVLLDHLAPLGIPVVAELPVGHGALNHAFAWGTDVVVRGGALREVRPR